MSSFDARVKTVQGVEMCVVNGSNMAVYIIKMQRIEIELME